MFTTEAASNSYSIQLDGATYVSFNHLRLLVGITMNALHEMEKRRLGHLDYLVLPRWRASYSNRRMLCCLSALLGDSYSTIKCPKIIAPKQLIAQLSRYYQEERPYHLDSSWLKSKSSYNESIDANPIPDLQAEYEFVKQYRQMNRQARTISTLEFVEMPGEGESLDFGGGCSLAHNQNTLSLASVFGSLTLSDGMPTTIQLPIVTKYPQKFRKIQRKLPFMHLSFRTRRFSLQLADSSSMYILAAGDEPSLTLLLYLNNRIVLIDPCQGITQRLSQLNLPLSRLESVIVTSARDCNSAGLFELMLSLPRINIITQEDIYNRLVSLYRDVYLMEEENIRDRLNLKAITIGSPIPYRRLQLKFFLGFSTELCLFFTVAYKEKSLVFYGNSIYDFEMIRQARQREVISKDRYRQLAELRWQLHAAMFFNIFESRKLQSFGQLPEAVREKLCLNCWPRMQPYPRKYLNLFEQEWDCIQLSYQPIYNRSAVMMDLPFIDKMPVQSAIELTQLFQETALEKGAKLQKIDPSKLYVVGSGRLRCEGKLYRKGDYFNAQAFFEQGATVTELEALEKSIVLWVSRPDFSKMFTEPLKADVRGMLLGNRIQAPKQNLFQRNRLNTDLSQFFLATLEKLAVPKPYSSGQLVWDIGHPNTFCLYISKGSLTLIVGKSQQQLTAGYFLGDVYSLMLDRPHSTKVEIIKDSHLLLLPRESLKKCFDCYPSELYYFLARPRLFQ